MNGATSLDADREVGPGVFNNFVKASGGENDIGPRGRIAPRNLGAATARNHGKTRVICKTKNSGKLLLAGRLENKPRLNTANCVSSSGRA